MDDLKGWQPPQECLDHWAKIRANLKPPVWPYRHPDVFITASGDEAADICRFIEARTKAYLGQKRVDEVITQLEDDLSTLIKENR